MTDLPLDEVHRLIAAANTPRWRGYDVEGDDRARVAEAELEARFRTSQTLAVYGTLAPGEPNHHIVAPLGGEWTEGVIAGDLIPVGWGATLGFPAFRPRPGGSVVPVKLLTAPALAAAWPELDRFEGAEYRRVLVPVFTRDEGGGRTLSAVANLYAAAEPLPVMG